MAFLLHGLGIKKMQELNDSGLIPKTKVRIGLHVGKVVTGNVGNETRKQFSVTGNAVITAARLEQLNKEYGTALIISESMFNMLDSKLAIGQPIERKEVQLKGRQDQLGIFVLA